MTPFTDSTGSGAEPEISDADLDSMLKGHRPVDGAPELQRVADAMNALTSPPERSELAGYSKAMAAYGSSFAQPRSRKVAMIPSATGLRALASAAGAAVALGAVATIVFASGAMGPARPTLVAPVATSATTDAAKSTPKPDRTGTPVGPDASGPAAFGLCNAWTHHQGKDKEKPGNSVAFRNLATAAGGEAKIAAYCATVPHPGSSNGTKTPKDSSTTKAPKPGKTTPPGKAKNGTAKPTRTPGASPTTSTPPPATLTSPGPASTLPTGAS